MVEELQKPDQLQSESGSESESDSNQKVSAPGQQQVRVPSVPAQSDTIPSRPSSILDQSTIFVGEFSLVKRFDAHAGFPVDTFLYVPATLLCFV